MKIEPVCLSQQLPEDSLRDYLCCVSVSVVTSDSDELVSNLKPRRIFSGEVRRENTSPIGTAKKGEVI